MRRSDACATFATGALLGLASFFTQTRGFVALVAFFAFAVWERWRKKCPWRSTLRDLAVLAAGFISTLLLFSAHFVASAGLARLWYFQVTYVRQYFARGAHELSLGLPEPIAWRTLPRLFQYLVIYALPLFVYPIVLWRCWHERRNPAPPWRQLALLALTGLFLLLEVITGLNWLRLYTVSMPGIILFVWVTSRATNIRRYAFAALWFGVVGLAVLQTALRHIHQSAAVQLPGGTVATTPEACAKLRWISQHTEPGQFFFQAGWPGVYLPLGLRNPAYVDGVGPGVATRPEDIASTIQWLEEKRVRFILWPARLEEQHEMDNVTPLRRYLHSHYTHVQTFPDGDVIWQRR